VAKNGLTLVNGAKVPLPAALALWLQFFVCKSLVNT
jgi:hypothetical protein